jgi:hypothetical protein
MLEKIRFFFKLMQRVLFKCCCEFKIFKAQICSFKYFYILINFGILIFFVLEKIRIYTDTIFSYWSRFSC